MDGIDRRTFLKGVGSAAVVGIALSPETLLAQKSDFPPNTPEGEVEASISQWPSQLKETYRELSKNFEEILNDPKEREQLVEDWEGKLLTAGANAPHMYPFLDFFYGQMKMLVEGGVYLSEKDREAPNTVEPLEDLVDVTHRAERKTRDRPALAQYRNLGVAHAARRWDEQKEKIYGAIHEADVILLENMDEWGPAIQRYARHNGKQVESLEGKGAAVAFMANMFALWCVYDMFKLNPLKQADRGQWTKEYLKSWMSQQLGIWPTSTEIAMRLTKYGDYKGRWTLGYTTDVRTIWMWLKIQKHRKENPDLKILSISGDEHAKGFEFYDTHPAEREIKRVIYNTVFCLHKIADQMKR